MLSAAPAMLAATVLLGTPPKWVHNDVRMYYMARKPG